MSARHQYYFWLRCIATEYASLLAEALDHARTAEVRDHVLRSHIANDWIEKYMRFAWMAHALLGVPPEPVEIAS